MTQKSMPGNAGFFVPKIQASVGVVFDVFSLMIGRSCRWFIQRDSMRAAAQGGAKGEASRHKKTDCLYKTTGYFVYMAEKQGKTLKNT